MGRDSGRPTEPTTIERVRTFAQGRAIAARALGRDDRDWLDLEAAYATGQVRSLLDLGEGGH